MTGVTGTAVNRMLLCEIFCFLSSIAEVLVIYYSSTVWANKKNLTIKAKLTFGVTQEICVEIMCSAENTSRNLQQQ